MFGTKGNKWRENMNSVMKTRGVWGDMKYTFNGNTYIIPAKILGSKKRTDEAIIACKTNDAESIKKIGIKIVGG